MGKKPNKQKFPNQPKPKSQNISVKTTNEFKVFSKVWKHPQFATEENKTS